MLGHLSNKLCFLADIVLSEMRLKYFSSLFRKILRTVSPRLMCFPDLEDWKRTTIANRCHIKARVAFWDWLQRRARKDWRVWWESGIVPYTWEVWRARFLCHKAGSFPSNPCFAWDVSIFGAPLFLLCTSVITHASPFSPKNYLLQCPTLRQAQRRSWGKTRWLNKQVALCTLLTQRTPFSLFLLFFLLFITSYPHHNYPQLSRPLCAGSYSHAWTHVLPLLPLWADQQWTHWPTMDTLVNRNRIRIMINAAQLIKHSLHHWILINDSLALICCWYLGINQRCFPHFVNILGFHLYSKF